MIRLETWRSPRLFAAACSPPAQVGLFGHYRNHLRPPAHPSARRIGASSGKSEESAELHEYFDERGFYSSAIVEPEIAEFLRELRGSQLFEAFIVARAEAEAARAVRGGACENGRGGGGGGGGTPGGWEASAFERAAAMHCARQARQLQNQQQQQQLQLIGRR